MSIQMPFDIVFEPDGAKVAVFGWLGTTLVELDSSLLTNEVVELEDVELDSSLLVNEVVELSLP